MTQKLHYVLTFALWESVVSVGASVAVVSLVLWFTGALTSADLADLSQGAVHVTLAFLTTGPTEVSNAAPMYAKGNIL